MKVFFVLCLAAALAGPGQAATVPEDGTAARKQSAVARPGQVTDAQPQNTNTVVGRIASNHDVVINVRSIPARAVVSWPVSVSDEISTATGDPATIQFKDGSSVVLQGDTKARVETARVEPVKLETDSTGRSGAGIVVRVLHGVATPSLVPVSSLVVFSPNDATVTPLVSRSAAPSTGVSSSTLIRGLVPTPGKTVQSVPTTPATQPVYGGLSGVLVQGQAIGGGNSPVVVLPNGARLTLTVNPSTNQYVVSGVSVPVNTGVPGSAPMYLPVTSTMLLNTTVKVSGIAPQNNGTTSVVINFFTSASKPIDPVTVGSDLQSSASQAFTAAKNSGSLPPASVSPQLNTPVKVGTFSPQAP
jgi:hypothetical protein